MWTFETKWNLFDKIENLPNLKGVTYVFTLKKNKNKNNSFFSIKKKSLIFDRSYGMKDLLGFGESKCELTGSKWPRSKFLTK